jgi:GNAT superfamily N-acetyltransferase
MPRLANSRTEGTCPLVSIMGVREIAESDRAEWEALWAGYNAFYGRVGQSALAQDVVDTTWHRFFDEREPVHAVVADEDGHLVGIAHYVFHRSTILIGDTCYLQDLFTSPDSRGTGVGRALINAVYEAARGVGIDRVYWHTHESNATARALYNKVATDSGFVVYRKILGETGR